MNIAYEKLEGEDERKHSEVIYILFQHILVRFKFISI